MAKAGKVSSCSGFFSETGGNSTDILWERFQKKVKFEQEFPKCEPFTRKFWERNRLKRECTGEVFENLDIPREVVLVFKNFKERAFFGVADGAIAK